MSHLYKNIHVTGNSVVLYSGFFFMKGLVDIKKKWLYGDDLIKKSSYCPHSIYCNNTKYHFTYNNVVAMDALCVDI